MRLKMTTIIFMFVFVVVVSIWTISPTSKVEALIHVGKEISKYTAKNPDVISPFWCDTDPSDPPTSFSNFHFNNQDLVTMPECGLKHEKCSEFEQYRRIDGFCNNREYPFLGSSQTHLVRLLRPEYDNGIMKLKSRNGRLLPNPRYVSNHLSSMKRGPASDVNVFWLIFGQFVDHDLVFVPNAKDGNEMLNCTKCDSWKDNSGCAPISVPENDADFNYYKANGERFCMPFIRSAAASSVYSGGIKSLEQFNFNTAFLDLSVVYGSDKCTEKRLRLYRSGQLIEQKHPFSNLGMLPLEPDVTPGRDCRNFNGKCSIAGDHRSVEQIGIMLMHILFLREHNRIARKLKLLNEHWYDEKIFKESRRINIAQYQNMVYADFLPKLLGEKQMEYYQLSLSKNSYYKDYNPSLSAQILSEFSTAAFRFGHSLVPGHFILMNKFYLPTESLPLESIFRNTSFLYEPNAIEDFTRGLLGSRIESLDPVVEKSLTNKLFIKDSNQFTALDLVAINIARGRDHGLPGYTTYRRFCRLKPIDSWDDLNIHKENINRLKLSYSSVHDIDLFVGGLTEFPLDGGLIGPTFSCIISQQFLRLKNGDRFWFENEQNHLRIDQLKSIKYGSTLHRILAFNLDHPIYLPNDVFNLPDKRRNPLISSTIIVDIDFNLWKEEKFSEVDCYYKGISYRPDTPVFISECLRCYCDSQRKKISCVEAYESCQRYLTNKDEACKLACDL